MRTYLSLDFDYWRGEWKAHGKKNIIQLIKRARKRDIPITAVMNHQQMLREINELTADRLVNVDEHADISDAGVDVLNCGTWVSYVRWRRGAEYLWIRNSRGSSLGDCNGSGPHWNSGHDWRRARSQYGGAKLDLLSYLRGCVGIGLCLSPEFSTGDMADFFRDIVSEFDIPYRKGRNDECNLARTLKPPFRGDKFLPRKTGKK